MDLRRLRTGEWILAISGVALVASLFLPWWSVPGLTEWNAWEVLSVTDVLLALLGMGAITAWIVVARATAASPGVAAEALLTPFALVMAIVCLVRVLNVPGDLEIPSRLGIETSIEYGAWLGLAATFGVLAGAVVGMRDERLSKDGRLTDATGVPVDRAVEVEKLPAPPAA